MQTRLLTIEDATAIHALHVIARETLPSRSVRADSPDFFREVIEHNGKIIGIEENRVLIAYGAIVFGDTFDNEYARRLNLSSHRIDAFARLEGSSVHPNSRGRDLQYNLIALRLQLGRKSGYRRHCATVCPENHASVKSLLKAGFSIDSEHLFYGDLRRFLMIHED